MNATDVVGYTHDGEFYCSTDCLPEGVDHDDNEEVGAVFADSEWDAYPVCASCGDTCEDVSLIHPIEDDTRDEFDETEDAG